MPPADFISQLVALTMAHDTLNAGVNPEELSAYYADVVQEGHLYAVVDEGQVRAFAECFWLHDRWEVALLNEHRIWPPPRYWGAIFYVHNVLALDRASLWKLWRQRPQGTYRLVANRLTGRRHPHGMDFARR